MALTVKQLNPNVSFLLTFEPLGGNIWKPFRILLDPVLITRPALDQKTPPPPPPPRLRQQQPESITESHEQGVSEKRMSSLRDMPEPDLVIITQGREGHLDEKTLRQLPPGNTKTLILAESSAAKIIQGWGYFDDGVVQVLPPWEASQTKTKKRGGKTVRLPVSPCYVNGEKGEVTVSLIPQKRDARGVHSAVGITYRPPPSRQSAFRRPTQTPPATPSPTASTNSSQPFLLVKETSTRFLTARLVPPTPPDSPINRPFRPPPTTLSPHTLDRALSVICSPHGTSYASLEPYVTSHLISEAALPLTCLLHSFGTESSPWWHLGNIGSAACPIGQEAALTLGARAWITTRDEGIASGAKLPRRSSNKTYTANELRDLVDRAEARGRKGKKPPKPVEILELDLGQEVMLTSEGIWQPRLDVPGKNIPDALCLFNDNSNQI